MNFSTSIFLLMNFFIFSYAQGMERGMRITWPKLKPIPLFDACNEATQPTLTWGAKGGHCLMSCGAVGGTQSFSDSCTNHNMIEAGSAYDVSYCCKQASSTANSKNFSDLVLAGYQGWFAAKGDSGLGTWSHWGPGVSPAPGRVTFENYPDVRDYSPADLFATNLGPLGNGLPSFLYSSASEGVVATHFQWMVQYGIDGISLQRFVSGLSSPAHRNFMNIVSRHVRTQAEIKKKIFYINYDISGAQEPTFIDEIKNDWLNEMQSLTSSPSYARQNGRPVGELWGLGLTDRPGTLQQVAEIIAWFKSRGVYVVGGVSYQWRTSTGSSKPGWTSTYLKFDTISPWSVGALYTDADVDNDLTTIAQPDRDLCNQHGVGYRRVLYPGFGWSNWNGNARNVIPRRAGKFLWRQFYKSMGVSQGAYIAMFDEYDEGTAIAKTAEDASMIPVNQYFYTLDADGVSLSSDFYLRLTGAATRMMKGLAPLQPTVPISSR